MNPNQGYQGGMPNQGQQQSQQGYPPSNVGQPGMGQPGMGQPGMGQPGMGQPGMGHQPSGYPPQQQGMGQQGYPPSNMGQQQPGMAQHGMGQQPPGYLPQQQGMGQQPPGYPPQQQGMGQQGYPPANMGQPGMAQQGMGHQPPGYPPQQQGMGQQGYPPQQQGYPSSNMGQPGMGQPGMGQPGMAQQPGGYPPQQQGYPPQQQSSNMGQPGMGQPGMGQPGMGQPGMSHAGMGQQPGGYPPQQGLAGQAAPGMPLAPGMVQGPKLTKFFVDIKQRLNRDYIVIMDKSGSMSGRKWEQAKEATMKIAPFACQADPDGITLYLFNNTFQKFEHLQQGAQVEQIFIQQRPDSTTNLASVLQSAFAEHFTTNRPTTILVITDGAPDSQTEATQEIVQASNRLNSDEELSVSFIQIGEDAGACQYLSYLDNNLRQQGAKFDIVDTVSSTSLGAITFDQLIEKSISD